ncbi:hypothetical protein E4T52_02251 [Aureobasidium sp. EXF-3400]|nr:hypothetical protein E4T51_11085 [Aureobasidium sp. EXF-12344]KAI4782845.1 hypothetical protein E4T52_02251 [Aureobasidium sp. EXF-3400]
MIIQTSLSFEPSSLSKQTPRQLPHEKDVIAHIVYPPLCAHILDFVELQKSWPFCFLDLLDKRHTSTSESSIRLYHTKHKL